MTDDPVSASQYPGEGAVSRQEKSMTDDPVFASLNVNRCAICGWVLMQSNKRGCTRGNCSLRPFPDRFYDPARAKAEYSPHLDNDPRTAVSASRSAGDLAKAIALDLFTNGVGQEANRLVLTGPSGQDLGGWCRAAVEERIAKQLAASRSARGSEAAIQAIIDRMHKYANSADDYHVIEGWADELQDALAALHGGAAPTPCSCHAGSVCGEACARGICHDGCSRLAASSPRAETDLRIYCSSCWDELGCERVISITPRSTCSRCEKRCLGYGGIATRQSSPVPANAQENKTT